MGQSTDGILVFGIPLEEGVELDFLEEHEGDFEYFVDAENGMNWETHDYKEREEARSKYPVDLKTHCSCDYPMYILAVPGTAVTAWRGHPQKIERLLEPTQQQIDALTQFAEKHGLTDAFEGEPGWYLCSMWC